MSQEDDQVKRKKGDALAAAMSHPVRSRIIFAIAEPHLFEGDDADDAGGGRGVTIRQIAEVTGRSKRSVRHHVDVLQKQGLVTILEARTEGGVLERFYGPSQRSFLCKEDLMGVSTSQQQKLVLEALKMIFADASSALRAGTYTDRPEWVANHFMTEVDEQGWHELFAIHERTRLATQQTLAEARERLQTSDATPIPVGSSGLLFVASPGAKQARAPSMDEATTDSEVA